MILLEAWRVRGGEGRIRRGSDERAFLKAMNMGMCMAFGVLEMVGWLMMGVKLCFCRWIPLDKMDKIKIVGHWC